MKQSGRILFDFLRYRLLFFHRPDLQQSKDQGSKTKLTS